MTKNGFLIDTQDRCLRNVNSGQVILCSVRWNPEVLIVEDRSAEDGEIVLIIVASERYSHYTKCFSAEQEARLSEQKS